MDDLNDQQYRNMYYNLHRPPYRHDAHDGHRVGDEAEGRRLRVQRAPSPGEEIPGNEDDPRHNLAKLADQDNPAVPEDQNDDAEEMSRSAWGRHCITILACTVVIGVAIALFAATGHPAYHFARPKTTAPAQIPDLFSSEELESVKKFVPTTSLLWKDIGDLQRSLQLDMPDRYSGDLLRENLCSCENLCSYQHHDFPIKLLQILDNHERAARKWSLSIEVRAAHFEAVGEAIRNDLQELWFLAPFPEWTSGMTVVEAIRVVMSRFWQRLRIVFYHFSGYGPRATTRAKARTRWILDTIEEHARIVSELLELLHAIGKELGDKSRWACDTSKKLREVRSKDPEMWWRMEDSLRSRELPVSPEAIWAMVDMACEYKVATTKQLEAGIKRAKDPTDDSIIGLGSFPAKIDDISHELDTASGSTAFNLLGDILDHVLSEESRLLLALAKGRH